MCKSEIYNTSSTRTNKYKKHKNSLAEIEKLLEAKLGMRNKLKRK